MLLWSIRSTHLASPQYVIVSTFSFFRVEKGAGRMIFVRNEFLLLQGAPSSIVHCSVDNTQLHSNDGIGSPLSDKKTRAKYHLGVTPAR